MLLAIELTASRLQLAVLEELPPRRHTLQIAATFLEHRRQSLQPENGIREALGQLESLAGALVQRFPIEHIGIAVDGRTDSRIVEVCNQQPEWNGFALATWCEQVLGATTKLTSTLMARGFAEASYGEVANAETTLYVDLGDQIRAVSLNCGDPISAGRQLPLGDLKLGLHAVNADQTLDSLASGFGLVEQTLARISGDVVRPFESLTRTSDPLNPLTISTKLENAQQADEEFVADLLSRAGDDPTTLTSNHVLRAADEGNELAREVLHHAEVAVAWGVATSLLFLPADSVVLGGSLSQALCSGLTSRGRDFLDRLVRDIQLYSQSPLPDNFSLCWASLGDNAALLGAIA